jgi:hypothetical protein
VEAGDFVPAFGACMAIYASETRNTYRVDTHPSHP